MDLPQNTFKRRLASGPAQLGFWLTIPDPSVAEAVAGAGFDWMVLDTEHTAVEVSAILPLLQAVAPYPVAPVVRPYVNDTALLKRHLDQGAQTLLLPMINSAAEAQAAVRAVRYAPRGVRGMAGTMRAARYGRVQDYAARADAEICLVLQIETVEAMGALEAIAAVDGVDALFFGPSDLAASMGYPGQPSHPEVRAAILTAIARAKAAGARAGLLTLNTDFARECLAAGADFVAVGVDMALLVGAVDALRAAFER